MKFKLNKSGELWTVHQAVKKVDEVWTLEDAQNNGYKEIASNLTRIEMIELISSLTYEEKQNE